MRRSPGPVTQRDLKIGDQVLWKATGGLIWNLKDLASGEATIEGSVFEQPVTRTVDKADLQLAPDETSKEGWDVERSFVRDPHTHQSSLPLSQDDAVQKLRPIKPRRELDELMDDVLFSPLCLRTYRRRFAPHLRGLAVNNELRDEIRRKGFLTETRQGQEHEFARIRVPGRFDVVLKSRPTPEHPVAVDGLYIPRKRGNREAAAKAGARRAA